MDKRHNPETKRFIEIFRNVMNENKTLFNYEIYEKSEEQYFKEQGKRMYKNYGVFKVSYHRFTKSKKR